jgi:septal ring factor EnvC (AmiA/AmiB activator)
MGEGAGRWSGIVPAVAGFALPRAARIAPWRCALALALALAAAALPAAAAPRPADREAAAEARLRVLEQRLAALDEAQRADEARRDEALVALRAADAAVAEADRRREAAGAAEAKAEAELAAREAERAVLAERLADERERLARLLRAAYVQGRHEQLRLLLAQDQVGAAQRALAYHRHLQRGRAAEIAALQAALAALAEASARVEQRRADLAAARADAEAAQAELQARRQAQAEAVAALQAGLAARAGERESLQRDRQALQALLAELRDAIADVPRRLAEDRPFASRRGELPLPVQGRVLRRFGAELPGGLRSDGVLFAAEAGSPVHAVAPGRVVYAGWLRGHGLLLVIDHGEGWMSLYGQGERLLREVGDWVGSGDPVARAGRSGGGAVSGIHFELRRNGEPVDPRGWWR